MGCDAGSSKSISIYCVASRTVRLSFIPPLRVRCFPETVFSITRANSVGRYDDTLAHMSDPG